MPKGRDLVVMVGKFFSVGTCDGVPSTVNSKGKKLFKTKTKKKQTIDFGFAIQVVDEI